jgi:hemoglobin-like flavoprotein
MDPKQLLKKQHREVEALFKKAEKAKPEQRRALMSEIAANLQLHMNIEEGIFYPAVKELGNKKAEELVAESFEEHHVVKLVIAELPKVDPEDERFEAKMTVLKELIEHHVEEEEDEMFDLADKLDDEILEDVGERMMAEVEKVKGRAA